MYSIRYKGADPAAGESDHLDIKARIGWITTVLENVAGDLACLSRDIDSDTEEGRAVRDLLDAAERAIGGHGDGVIATVQEAWEEVESDEWEDDDKAS